MLDSGSTDDTLAICKSFPNVFVVHRPFDSFANQCNFGLTQVSTPWVLSIDADYLLPPGFPAVVEQLSGNADGYFAEFRYVIYGRALRSCLYPPRTVLYRTSKAKYCDVGHGHRVVVSGVVESCGVVVDHDDHKPLSRWLASQSKYALREADHLLLANFSELSTADRIRTRIWPAVPAVLIYCLLWKRLILDGWPGIFYTLQRAYAELLLSLELLDRKLRGTESSVGSRQSPGNRE